MVPKLFTNRVHQGWSGASFATVAVLLILSELLVKRSQCSRPGPCTLRSQTALKSEKIRIQASEEKRTYKTFEKQALPKKQVELEAKNGKHQEKST